MQATSPYYEIANNFATLTNRSLFLTGKAGTGKTTFLKQLKERSKKEMAIVAPTGVAAINAGGVTIHSFFQLPFHPLIPTAEGKKDLIGKLKINSARRKVLYELELLVIDEISMVRADVLDAIDTILRHFKYKRNEPFGGVQLIFIGDMYQLSPVYKEDEWQMLSSYYSGMYFFDSLVIKQQPPVYIEFDKIFRQSNLNFIKLLNEVRNNNISDEGFEMLQQLYNPDFKLPKNDIYITLTTHNYKADNINSEELEKLKGKPKKFKAKITGDYPEKSYPTEEELEFKVGAKVMFLKNDKESPRRYFNGKIGEIIEFDDDFILVKCPGDDEAITVTPETWENNSYTTNVNTKQIEETLLGTFVQFPLRLAWAITIHKSQGLTFDKAIIDAGQAFAPGQVYVALSRCRSLEGMVLLSKIDRSSLKIDHNIVEHSKQKLPIEILDNQLDVSKREYREHILLAVFDFKTVVGQLNRLMDFVKEKASSFNEETLPFLNSLHEQLENIQNIATRFQNELQRMMLTDVDEKKLQERITSAVNYFTEQLKNLIEELKQSPASTDSKGNATDYNDDLKTIFTSLAEKLHIFKSIKDEFTVENYYIAKNTLLLPPFTVNAYAGSNESKKPEAKFPILYYKLSDLRKKICDSANIPIYLVSSTKGLTEVATYLPQTLDDMQKMHGFGPATITKYGQQFLDIVLDYCEKNNLQSFMYEKETTKKERKKKEKEPKLEKPKKEDTKQLSFDLYKRGFSITEIATARDLTKTTIEGHLAHFVGTGEIPLRNFVNKEKEEKIVKVLKTEKLLSNVFSVLNGEVSYVEIKMVIADRENKK